MYCRKCFRIGGTIWKKINVDDAVGNGAMPRYDRKIKKIIRKTVPFRKKDIF